MTSQEYLISSTEQPYAVMVNSFHEHGRKMYGGTGYSRVVFTNGCFDLIHPGHIKLLNYCRSLAGPRGAVVVGVNSDRSVRSNKGQDRPFTDQLSRASILVALRSVDCALIFDEDTPLKLIEVLCPDVIVKGSDYKGQKVVGSEFAPVIFVDTVEGFSSTSLSERIKNGR